MQYFNYILDPGNDFLGHTIDYLKICGFSIFVAFIMVFSLVAFFSRIAFLAFLALIASCLLRSIPIVAFFILFVFFFAVGFVPAVIALIVIGIPPILLNTYTGIRGIDPAT